MMLLFHIMTRTETCKAISNQNTVKDWKKYSFQGVLWCGVSAQESFTAAEI